MFYEKLQELAKSTGKSFNQIENDLNYSKNTLYHYRKTNPTQDRLLELADYFNVSVDYLLGRTENRKEDLTDQENDLVRAFRIESEDMSEEEQAQFNKSLKDMMKIAKDLLNDDSNWKK
ncbi:helix-turn-helix transcriptional regulator [Lactococcus lactis]|uniref:helix-turn-helix domain-containing protein n=1 Tax=Lactococcus lactis TaxID=1358 RepID=UPI0038780589